MRFPVWPFALLFTVAAMPLPGIAQGLTTTTPDASSLSAQRAYTPPLTTGQAVSVRPDDKRVRLRVQNGGDTKGPVLAFSVTGRNIWAVGEWKWAGNAGRSLTAPERLTLRVRVAGKVPPDLALGLALTGPPADAEAAKTKPRAAAAGVRFSTYEQEWADGTWHSISIPVADLLTSPNGLDTARIDGISFSAWVGEPDADFTLFVASAEFALPPAPAPAAPIPGPSPAEKQQQARLEAARALAARIRPGMTRSEVELIFPVRDPVFTHAERTRYLAGSDILVEVPFDVTGGINNRENRVKALPRVFAGKIGDK